MHDVRRRILYIDAYDSFANNIISLIRLTLNVDVEVITHDEYKDIHKFEACLRHFDAVVVGPGPGDPRNQQDVGIIRHLWSLSDRQVLPVLGICLGFQDLCLAFGGEIKKLQMPRHGIVSQVSPVNQDIFTNFPRFEATNYHSLHVDLLYGADASVQDLSRPSPTCPAIQPLAWDMNDATNGPVLLAARHTSKPFWGVQYHPESICTSKQGSRIVSSWWNAATSWLEQDRRAVNRAPLPRLCRQIRDHRDRLTSEELADENFRQLQAARLVSLGSRVRWRRLYRHVAEVNDLCKELGFDDAEHDEAILLRSGKQKDGSLFGQGLGRFSIIGIIDTHTIHLQYDVHSKTVRLHNRDQSSDLPEAEHVQNIFSYIQQFMSSVQVSGGPVLIPFWGGLMGYVSYEAGLETIDVQVSRTMSSDASNHKDRPDVNFAFVTRSIVLDHALDTIYIQSIRNNDSAWLEATRGRLEHSPPVASNVFTNEIHKSITWTLQCQISKPDTSAYAAKIDNCLNSIRAGDSYEICLTDRTTVNRRRQHGSFASGWKLFQRLSTTNPAPFSSFLRLHSPSDVITVVSSSPERFLSWSRSGHCQFRPIKGTVKKTPGTTYKQARAILESSKERAENLMITDLIRHDLHGVAKLGSVNVPKLMQIEEFATVYQLVSVIEGDISGSPLLHSDSPINSNSFNHDVSTNGTPVASISPTSSTSTVASEHQHHNHLKSPPANKGIDLLASSLPPGSMSGAPKRRSCELISNYEDGAARGVYSGVLGYLDVGGGGDFAVVIRTAVRWDGDSSPSSTPSADDIIAEQADHQGQQQIMIDTWKVGAGGAITAQSNPADEYAEMLTKLDSTLGAFL